MCKINWVETFDRFYWDFFFSALQKFVYGDKFIQTIKVVFTTIQSKIKINGLTSDFSLKYLELILVTVISKTFLVTISEDLTKKIHIWNNVRIFES